MAKSGDGDAKRGENGAGGGDSKALSALASDVWEWQVEDQPLWASYVGLGSHDRVDERGAAARDRRRRATEGFLGRLAGVGEAGLRDEERLTRALLERSLSDRLEAFRHHAWEWDLDQMDGVHLTVPALAQVQPLRDAKDVAALLARYEALPPVLAAWAEDLRDGLRSGRVAPRVGYERVRGQFAAFSATKPEETAFVQALDRLPAAMPEAERSRLRARAVAVVRETVLPGYRAFLRFLDEEYSGKARETPGVWSIPGGEEDYAFRVRRETTTSLTPNEIHEIGLEQLAKNREEILAIARSQGHAGDLRSFFDAIGADPRWKLSTREEVLDRYRQICRRMEARLPEAFGILPRAACIVKPLEEWREKDAPGAFYLEPSRDGTRPGMFYANTYQPETWPTYDMEALSYHEAVPGHHLQIAIQTERSDLPDVRKHFSSTAYIEGWAHYAERLADEMGAYSGPLDRVGMLAAQAWRAARLVVDTGMHALRWSRERTVDLLRSIRSGPLSDVSNETDRYVIWPGQALAYKIGHLTFARLREEAKARLKSRFSLRGFHDTVLRHGALPLSVLEDVVARWDGTSA
jgi:uncharacterized protein (DUF885 family)